MPEYIYRCKAGHEQTIIEPMFTVTTTWCAECGAKMARKPQIISVNWGGLAPSQGELAPVQKAIIEGAPERRDKEVPHLGRTLAKLKDNEL